MKIWILVVLFVAVGLQVSSLDASVYEEAGVVSFFSQTLSLGAKPIFEYELLGHRSYFDLNLNGDYSLVFQNPTWHIWAKLPLSIALDYDEYNKLRFHFDTNSIHAFVNAYFTELPFRLGGGGLLHTDLSLYPDEVYTSLGLDWFGNIGIGRVINVTPVAQIVKVARVLGIDPTNEQVLDASQVISKSEEYKYLYREKYEETYYGAIANALDSADRSTTIRRLLDTLVVSPRQIGWSVQAKYQQSYFTGSNGESFRPIYLSVDAKFGIPLGLNMQLSPSLYIGGVIQEGFYPKNSADNRIFRWLDIDYYIDRTNDWSSSISLGLDTSHTAKSRSFISFTVWADTEILVLERLKTGVSARFRTEYETNVGRTDIPSIDVKLWFKESMIPGLQKRLEGYYILKNVFIPVVQIFDCDGSAVSGRVESFHHPHEIEISLIHRGLEIAFHSVSEVDMGSIRK